jgi:hypothetical protein
VPAGWHSRIKVVKEIISGTHTVELFVQCLESQMERHEGCSLKMHESGKKKVRISLNLHADSANTFLRTR